MKAKLIKVDGTSYYNLENERGTLIGTSFEFKTHVGNNLYSLSFKNCQAIENGYDLDAHSLFLQAGKEYLGDSFDMLSMDVDTHQIALVAIRKAVEILGDKMFTISQVIKLCTDYYKIGATEVRMPKEKRSVLPKEIIEDLKRLQQTEWDCVIVVNEKTKEPLLDNEHNLILKRK